MAFLPKYDVVNGIQVLHDCITDVEKTDKLQMLLVTCADDSTSVPRIRLRQLPLLFPVSTWNVYIEQRLLDEAWNRGIGQS